MATLYGLLRPAMSPIVYCWRRTLRPPPRCMLRPPLRLTLRLPPRRCTLLLANRVKGFKGLRGQGAGVSPGSSKALLSTA